MKVTISDIARMANVSKGTVSRVINNNPEGVSPQVRQKILEIIDAVGYQPSMIARSLVTSQSKEIAIILPDISNPFFPAIVRGAEDCALSEGYTIFICNSDGDCDKEEEYIIKCVEKRVAGIILTSNAVRYPTMEKIKPALRPPMIMLDRNVKDEDSVIVQTDNRMGSRMATEHLIECGCKRIAYLGGVKEMETSCGRLQGYSEALEEAGINYDEEIVFHKNFSIDAGFEMSEKLLESKKSFDGIFAACDLIALGAIKTLRRNGIKVPKDVMVSGYDNIYMSSVFEPELTTVDQHPYEMGRIAVETLIKIIDKKYDGDKRIILKPDLIIRSSTRRDDGAEK